MISALIVASSLGRAVGTAGGALVWEEGGLLAISIFAAVITAFSLLCLVWGLRNWRPESALSPRSLGVSEEDLRMTDILVKNGTIATMDQQANVYQNGSLYVKDGRIVAVGEQVDVSGSPDHIIDAEHKVVLPAL